jgi:transposase
MNRDAFDSLDREGLLGVALAQGEAIERQAQEIATLRAEIAELRAKLDRPPKTPDNSSLPPSRGHKKTVEFVKNRRKKKPHPGAHRPLDPNPTHRRDILASVCEHCGADVSGSPQESCEAYDRIDIPPIAPEITRVTLHGGRCPCCDKRFKAAAPAGLEPGSPPGSKPGGCAPLSSICASPRGSLSSGCRA